jgi:ferredoxin
MIIAERKTFDEIKQIVGDAHKILIVGCGTCVAVCMAGGEKEVGILASLLRLDAKREGRELEIIETTVERQCDKEYLEPLAKKVSDADGVVSLACGAGVQFLAEMYDTKRVLPGLKTRFIGVAEHEGMWTQRCMACSDCILGETGGICPVTICPKGLLNGPCGGTNEGKCEVDNEKDCAWTLIYRRLEKTGGLNNIKKLFPPKRYDVQTKPGKVIHPAYEKGEGKAHE